MQNHRLRRVFSLFILAVVALIAVVPLANFIAGEPAKLLSGAPLVALHFLGWVLVLSLILNRMQLRESLAPYLSSFGIESDEYSLESALSMLLQEISRKNEVLSMNLLERKIADKDELSRVLERIVSLARAKLQAESAELSLYDHETGQYTSSFVFGKPFRSSAQAMLSGASSGTTTDEHLDVMIQPIAFAGSVLGSLRVALQPGRIPSLADRQLLTLLALQSGLAVLNAQYSEQLLRLRAASEESVKAKTGFLANLSHELRGPLGIITNAVELVVDGLCGPVSEDQAETLQMVRQNAEHLLELVNDVLDFAKVESGKVVPQKADILVSDILSDIAAVVRKQAEQKSHTLRVLASDDALAIRCDRRHFRQMLINLLTNAIKYTPEKGSIEIWAERAPGNRVRINVKDSGVGIDSRDRNKVFVPFIRLDNAYSLSQVGTGLGLSLTKRLAEVNGGTLNFESVPQQGSRFWLNFPAADPAQAFAEDQALELPKVRGNGDQVLLIQHHQGERAVLARYLEAQGFRLGLCSDQVEATELLDQQRPKLIVIDSDMLVHGGKQFVQKIREHLKSTATPIILISSRGFVFDIENYLKLGIDRCLVKPVQLRELAFTARKLIDGTFQGDVVDKGELDSKDNTPRFVAGKILGIDDLMH
jgi:signal transduction histidine kinase/CheY-like chemotaxis protein